MVPRPDAPSIDLVWGEEGGPFDARAITDLVNLAYVDAQREIFLAPAPRATYEEVADALARGELLLAVQEGVLVGAVRVRRPAPSTWFFGMLAVAPSAASRGVARQLLDGLEAQALAAGASEIELDLLLPEPATAHQARLRDWYERRGFRRVSARPFAEVEPVAAALLSYPTLLLRYVKSLGGD